MEMFEQGLGDLHAMMVEYIAIVVTVATQNIQNALVEHLTVLMDQIAHQL